MKRRSTFEPKSEPIGLIVARSLFSLAFLIVAALGFIGVAMLLGKAQAPESIAWTCFVLYGVAVLVAYIFLKLTNLGKYLWDIPPYLIF